MVGVGVVMAYGPKKPAAKKKYNLSLFFVYLISPRTHSCRSVQLSQTPAIQCRIMASFSGPSGICRTSITVIPACSAGGSSHGQSFRHSQSAYAPAAPAFLYILSPAQGTAQ
jgi:disulfide bond formation protein DsbB